MISGPLRKVGSVWKEVSVQECWEKNDAGPNRVRWVVTNKGDKANPNVRARLVARHFVAQFGGKGLVELFAAMPPFEMIKYLLVRAIGGGSPPFGAGNPSRQGKRKILFFDVSKAHLYAPIEEDANVYVALPPECTKDGICGRLNFCFYGMRPASKG